MTLQLYLVPVNVILLIALQLRYLVQATTFTKTYNITQKEFSTMQISSLYARNIIECGKKCVGLRKNDVNKLCNAFSYDSKTNICEPANITALQDLQKTQDRKKIYIDVDTFPLVSMKCAGGRGCCSKQFSKGCGIGEGDCDDDNDCEGNLVCGKRSCGKYNQLTDLWDENDDCCERRCTHDHPCEVGDGHCEWDSDCAGYQTYKNRCAWRSCKNETFLPKYMYGINYVEGWYEDNENCCYQDCDTDVDCLENQKCDTSGSVHKCVTDPCKVNKESKYKAGRYAYCYGSWSGQYEVYYCYTGFENFVPYEGCSDRDECQTWYRTKYGICNGTVTVNDMVYEQICVNTIGSYECYYSEGTRAIGWGSVTLPNVELPVSWKILIYDSKLGYLEKNRETSHPCFYGKKMQPQFYTNNNVTRAARADMADGHVICGGYYNHKSCYKYISITQEWVQMESMLKSRRDFGLVALKDKLFAIGGDSSSCEVWSQDEGWKYISHFSLPGLFHTRLIVDEVTDKIHLFGGTKNNNHRVYDVDNNIWYYRHFSLFYTSYSYFCLIIKHSNTEKRWLYLMNKRNQLKKLDLDAFYQGTTEWISVENYYKHVHANFHKPSFFWQENGEVPQYDYSPKSTIFRPSQSTWFKGFLYELDIDAQILVVDDKECNYADYAMDAFMIRKTSDILVSIPKS